MKRKMVFGVLAFLLVLQAQTVFAADTYSDFNNAVKEGNFSRAERILKNNAHKWSIGDQGTCWSNLAYTNLSNSTALRTAQLLYQYKVNFDDNTIGSFIAGEKSEELSRYLFSIGMPIGNYAIGWAFNRGYSDNFVQLLLEKGGTLSNWALRAAAKNRRWALLPDLINRSTEDTINYRQTRDEYTAYYNSQSAAYKQTVSFNYDPSESKTALMFSAQYGQLRIVRMLVEKGARVNLRADDGATAASLAYDNGEMDIYDYLKSKGARDFEPRQVAQQPAAPAQSTTNVYVQPSAPAQNNNQSQPRPTQNTPAAPKLEMGTYFERSVTGAEIVLFTNTNKATHQIRDRTATSTGNISISGDQLIISWDSGPLRGTRSVYHIDSKNQFSGSGEIWKNGF